jgi:hypothetical protein
MALKDPFTYLFMAMHTWLIIAVSTQLFCGESWSPTTMVSSAFYVFPAD